MTTELVDFINARLDEDEAIARACSPWPWEQIGNRVIDAAPISTELGLGMGVGHSAASSTNRMDAAHIARHDPARALAEIEAKRGLLTIAELNLADDPTDQTAQHMAHLLAAPYNTHPDYRPEWAPQPY